MTQTDERMESKTCALNAFACALSVRETWQVLCSSTRFCTAESVHLHLVWRWSDQDHRRQQESAELPDSVRDAARVNLHALGIPLH